MRYVSQLFLVFSLINVTAQSATAAECAVKSGAQTVPLLELYTSEGCSSCPPADAWLSDLKLNDTAPVTPLAFHVDYWDYIGWRDRYAKPEFSARQRKLAALDFSTFVYTPQFTLNSKDFRGVSSTRFNQVLETLAKQPTRANLSLQASHSVSGEIMINANAKAVKPEQVKHAQVFIAIYQNQLVSKVQVGENSGRELKHNYVVREFFGGYPLSGQFSKTITLKPEWKGRDAGAVVFVQDISTGDVWQTLRLPFCS